MWSYSVSDKTINIEVNMFQASFTRCFVFPNRSIMKGKQSLHQNNTGKLLWKLGQNLKFVIIHLKTIHKAILGSFGIVSLPALWVILKESTSTVSDETRK